MHRGDADFLCLREDVFVHTHHAVHVYTHIRVHTRARVYIRVQVYMHAGHGKTSFDIARIAHTSWRERD